MAATLSHRGPDDQGLFRDEICALAHRRLAVLDLSSAGHQPMSSPDERHHMAINGEVYNFSELRDRFSLNSPPLRSRTDSEVVLRLANRLGVASALPHLDGMYALAIWDQGERQLHLARDPFGIKPLFTLQHDGVLWFSSEIKPLLGVPGFTPRPSLEALHHFLSLDYIPGHHTAFAGIEELRPGHTMQVDAARGTIQTRRFIDLHQPVDPALDLETSVEESLRLLTAAVRRQLISDVPVGVMLSGGLDSSAIVALTSELRGEADFHTYALGFEVPSFDESADAQRVARHFGTTHHEIRVTPQAVRDLLPVATAHIDEPYGDGSAIPTLMLAREAAQDVTVLLSGEGGDELFSGYDTHAAAVARRRYRWIPGPIRRGLVAPLVGLLPVSHEKLSFEFKAKRFVHGAELGLAASHHAWRVVLTEDAKRLVLQDPSRFAHLPPTAALFEDALKGRTEDEPLAQLLHIDRSHHLPDDLMVKNDRMTMAHSLEARVPFCDLALARFLSSVPARHKMHGLSTKVLLRRAMASRLPPETCRKKKIGLEMPYSSWLRSELHDLARDTLAPARVAATGLLDPAGITSLLDEHCAMKVDHGRALWGLLSFMIWHDLYIDSQRWRDHVLPARDSR
jgi:asparagine synthase (glutamine-hydrolysing)